MIAPTFTGRQWVEEDGAAEPTALADVSLALHEQQKRQLGFALTLGDAVFSIGLGPNGLPAFTVELNPPVAPAPTPTPAATTLNLARGRPFCAIKDKDLPSLSRSNEDPPSM